MRTPDISSPVRAEFRVFVPRSASPDALSAFLADEILRGQSAILVSADNRFRPDVLVQRSREAGQPAENVLSRLHLSRAFTIHQLRETVSDRVEPALLRSRATLVVVTGILPLFSDESVDAREAFRVLELLRKDLELLPRHGCRVLVPVVLPLPPSRRARNLFLRLHGPPLPEGED